MARKPHESRLETMKRFLELAKRWPYLPHFRVVAEFENLARASRRFGISPAALSKAIRTLERQLETELFERVGGKLKLNDQGRILLDGVRGAMRDLDEGMARIQGNALPQLVRVAIDSAWTTLVIPSVERGGSVELHDPPGAIARALLRGDVDVVIHTHPVTDRGVDSLVLAILPCAVYVARRHPLARLAAPQLADVTAAAFAVAKLGVSDGWPPHVPRSVALTTSSLAHTLAAVTGGEYAAILPRALAKTFELHALEIGLELGTIELFATTRKQRPESSAAATRWRATAAAFCAATCGA